MLKIVGSLAQRPRVRRGPLGFANRHAGKLLVIGLAVTALHNWRLWQRDKTLLARKGQAEPMPSLESWPALPKVSVLVAAWNEADIIGEHIASFRRLRYPKRELVLCAGGEDETYGIAERLADEHIILLRQGAGEGKQSALQRCLEHSKGSIIMLTDGDSLLSDDAFEALLRPIVSGAEVAATGRSRPLACQLSSPYVRYRWFIDAYMTRLQGPYTTGLLGRNAVVRREVLVASGEFQMPVKTGTDYHLAKRLLALGYRIRTIPASVVETRYPQNAAQYMRAQTRWLRNIVLHGLLFGAYDEALKALFPSLLGLFLLAGLVVGPLMGGVALAGWTITWTHALLSRIRSLRFGKSVCDQRVGVLDYLRLPVYALTDFSAWALTLLQYPVRSLRSRW